MAKSSKRLWVPNTHRVVGLRPIAEAPLDGREVLVTDGVYWRVAIPKAFRDGIWEYHRDDANCPGHTWSCAPTHFILIEDLPQAPARDPDAPTAYDIERENAQARLPK